MKYAISQLGYMLFILSVAALPLIISYKIIKRYLERNYASTTQAPENELVRLITSTDPTFNPKEFKNEAIECFKEVQLLLAKCDEKLLISHVSTELYNNYKSEIDLAKLNKLIKTIHLEDIGKIKITKYTTDAHYEKIGLKVGIKLKKIDINPETNTVIRYDDVSTYQYMYLEFIRTIKNKNEHSDVAKECPNCGAHLKINAQGNCIYCKSLIVNGTHSWVLNKVENFHIYE